MISYSYDGAENFRDDDITIEIVSAPSRVPTNEELRLSLHPYQELVQVADKWIVITDKAFGSNEGELIVVASFVHNGLSYGIGARPPLTKQDVILMIESMRIAG